MLYVADEIMHERAVLLPHVSLTAYTENSDAHQTVHVLKVGEGTVSTMARNTEVCGWCKSEGGVYTYDWECPEVISRVTDTIHFLTKGCSCKKGCQTNQCGCRKKGNTCGPGCQCQGCSNVGPAETQPTQTEVDSDTDIESEYSCSDAI